MRILLVCVVLGLGACTTQGQRLDTARAILAASGETVATAASTLSTVDKQRLDAISLTCPDRATCLDLLVAEDRAFSRAHAVVMSASAVLTSAAQVVSLVDSGVKTWEDVAALLPGLVDLGVSVNAAVEAFKAPGVK